jgi:hypothetical protein
MHKLTQSKILITLLTFGFLLACFTGCSEDTDEDSNGEALALPPDDSMTIDLSTFGESKLEAPVLPNLPGTRLNFAAAAATASVINTIVVAKLTAPVAVFTAAKNTTPVKQDDGSWLWSYSRTIGSETFTANLTGKRDSDKVIWSMKVSSNTNSDNWTTSNGTLELPQRTMGQVPGKFLIEIRQTRLILSMQLNGR